MKRNSDEYWIALRAFASEFDIRQNNFGIADLFLSGPGRVFLRDWTRRDAIDPDVYDGVITSGERWQEADKDRQLMAKWADRTRLYVAEHGDALRDIVDWLWSAARDVAPWTRNVDADLQPKKLMKCGTVAALLAEARKQERLQAQRLPTALSGCPLRLEDEAFVLDLGVGYSLVRLLTAPALDRESSVMHHCIGGGAYDTALQRPDFARFFSVRDPDGRAVATIESRVDTSLGVWVVRQFRGPWNEAPEPHVRDLFEGCMSELNVVSRQQANEMADARLIQIIQDNGGRYG